MQIETIELVGGTKARAKDVNDNIHILKNAIYELEENINAQTLVLEDLKRRPTRHMFDIYFSLENSAPTGAYPLWTGDWINHCDTIYPEFWGALKTRQTNGTLPMCSASAYETSLEKYGQCAQFVLDELNGRVRLPKITRFISSVSDIEQIGSVENDAIRNITGSFKGGYNTTYFSASSGAFYRSESGYADSAGGSGSNNRPTEVFFDASRSVPTANENRPKNVRMGLYIQISNNTADVSSLNTQVIADSLAEAIEELNALKEQLTQTLMIDVDDKVQAIQSAGVSAEENIKATTTLCLQSIDDQQAQALSDIDEAQKEAETLISVGLQSIKDEEDQALSDIEKAKQQATADLSHKMDQIVSHICVLPVSAWTDNAQTVVIDGMTNDKIVWVSPTVSADYGNETAYTESGLWCADQGDGTLLFKCQTLPDIDISITIVF